MSKETGGQAFPGEYSTFDWDGDPAYCKKTRTYHHTNGMTLRDYFAAKAMQGLLANPGAGMCPITLTAYAYETADAMIAERDKGE